MTNAEFYTGTPKSFANVDLLVDGEKISGYIFLYQNLIADDVNHISIEDAKRVVALELNEVMFIETVRIKRIS